MVKLDQLTYSTLSYKNYRLFSTFHKKVKERGEGEGENEDKEEENEERNMNYLKT